MKPAPLLLPLALACFVAASMLARGAEPPARALSALIDRHVGEPLQTSGIHPAEPADDLTLLRRTTLDLVGRIPTVGEARSYLEAEPSPRRAAMVDRLMASPGFDRHQANAFDALLMQGSSASLRDYLRAAFAEGRPWDEMFRDLLAVPSGAESPAAAYVKARVKDLDQLTNDASVAFFGVNVSCAKCHDHPLVPEWTQAHFYGMKSFFSRTYENGDFLGERDYGLVKYTTTSGDERLAELMFLSGVVAPEPPLPEPTAEEKKAEKQLLEELKKNKQPPPPPTFSRREQLIGLALQGDEHRYFARAIVNHIWLRLLGQGLVMPADQMHPENPGRHPELLAALAEDLVAHDYDLRRLIRGVVLSDTYGRASRWEAAARPSPELFAVANVRPLDPFQYATSLRLAAANPDRFSGLPDAELAETIRGVQDTAETLAAEFEQPVEDYQVSVTEALLLSNSPRVMGELLRAGEDTLVGKLLTLDDPAQRIETAVWNVLVRPPDAEELRFMQEHLERSEDQLAACQQLVWALLASSEARFNY